MFHIRPNKAGLYVSRARARERSIKTRDRYLSSPRRVVVDIAASRRWIFGEIDIL